ncbi:aminotransferase class III-fold pyridoxal phosphate-dependent enzyme [Solirubrobacter taibaiensis]|nr:aminotransferase class III-fold pyridoxal phosphate-dependent enzyme [Solirubrobacter taibaiensis]
MTELAALSPEERRALLARRLRIHEGIHPFARHVNPTLARMLEAVGLDLRYVRGDGAWLIDARRRRYLDCAAGYGAVPFGHNPPEVWHALEAVRAAGEPAIVQPSLLDAAGALAASLLAELPRGLDRVAFANSGAEAVEAALKLAHAATGRHLIVATDDGFHGKTLGALSATGRVRYQTPFGAPVEGFRHVPYGDLDALGAILRAHPGEVAAFVVEPIQGEGGIVEPPAGYLSAARGLCSEHGALLALDEVQTGLGRTGRLFALEHEAIVPDILVLSKALGGGLLPVAATVYGPAAHSEAFLRLHTSTFAANAPACRVGVRVLELLTRDERSLVRAVAETGARLRERLESLRERYPALVTDVRGRGLLLGVELTSDASAFRHQSLLGGLAEQEQLAPLVCSDLLHRGGVRVAPTLFGGRVIRVEPPLTINEAECDVIVEAFERTLATLERCDTATLVSGTLGGTRSAVAARLHPPGHPPLIQRAGEPRWAFVMHPLDRRSYRDFDASLDALSDGQLETFTRRLERGRGPGDPGALPLGSLRVVSAAGGSAFGELIGLPLTSDELLDLPAADALERVGEAVELARERGAEVVGLGAFTSIVTANATALRERGIPLTTGNAFTVAAALEALERGANTRGTTLADAHVGVVGATGAIGRGVALLLAERCARLTIVGNPAGGDRSLARLRATARDIAAHLTDASRASNALATVILTLPGGQDPVDALTAAGVLRLASDVDVLSECALVVVATSTPHPFLGSRQLAPGAVVCDVSQPSNVHRSIRVTRPDTLIIDGGVIEVPGRADLGISFGLPPGHVYACMAETILLALDGRAHEGTVGARIDADAIATLSDAAHRHGFRVSVPDVRAVST